MALLAGSTWAAAPARDKIESTISKVLPKGWSISSSKGRVQIMKQQEVTFYNAVSMSPQEGAQDRVRSGSKGVFKIQLIIGPLLSQQDYSDIKQTLPKGFHSLKANIPDQPFYSVNYDGLPDLHGPDYSVYISTSRHPYTLVWPENLNKEWQKVLAAIEDVFEKYN